jgi:hypothetical protein
MVPFWVGVPRDVPEAAAHHIDFLFEESDPLVRLAQLRCHVVSIGRRSGLSAAFLATAMTSARSF